jgi:hypothetical protein
MEQESEGNAMRPINDSRLPQSFIDEYEAQQQALDQFLGDDASPTLAEMDGEIYSLSRDSDFLMTCMVWEGFRTMLHDAILEVTRQRDDAIRERDQARAQLQRSVARRSGRPRRSRHL